MHTLTLNYNTLSNHPGWAELAAQHDAVYLRALVQAPHINLTARPVNERTTYNICGHSSREDRQRWLHSVIFHSCTLVHPPPICLQSGPAMQHTDSN